MHQDGQMSSLLTDLTGCFQDALTLPSATCDAMKSFFVLANTGKPVQHGTHPGHYATDCATPHQPA